MDRFILGVLVCLLVVAILAHWWTLALIVGIILASVVIGMIVLAIWFFSLWQ